MKFKINDIMFKSFSMLICEFIEECISKKLIEYKDLKYYLGNYVIEEMFWNWFVGFEIDEKDFYVDGYPIVFETLDELVIYIFDSRKWVFE